MEHRHTAATLAVVAGATTKELMACVGHSTPDMAVRYQHIMQGCDAIIAAGLDRLIQAGAADGAKPDGTDVARQERKRGMRSRGRDLTRGNVVHPTCHNPNTPHQQHRWSAARSSACRVGTARSAATAIG
jgi:hypothetical protein